MFDKTLDYIVSKLDERRTEINEFLGQGSAKDYAEYQKLCGVIQGLDTAKQFILDLAKRLETEEHE